MRDGERIVDELGGFNDDEIEAIVKHLDSKIWVWERMAESEREEDFTDILENLRRRRDLFAELAQYEGDQQAVYEERHVL
jgi:hypothetical protein